MEMDKNGGRGRERERERESKLVGVVSLSGYSAGRKQEVLTSVRTGEDEKSGIPVQSEVQCLVSAGEPQADTLY